MSSSARNFYLLFAFILISIAALLWCGMSLNKITKSSPKVITHTVYAPNYDYQYLRCITNLMLSEDYRSCSYNDASGNPTIGFGHQIKKGESFPCPIKFITAYELLISDFNGSVAFARELGYYNDNNQQLAVAHAIFCMGIGTVKTIRDFENDILRYSYYKSKGKIIFSEQVFKARKFEYELFTTTK